MGPPPPPPPPPPPIKENINFTSRRRTCYFLHSNLLYNNTQILLRGIKQNISGFLSCFLIPFCVLTPNSPNPPPPHFYGNWGGGIRCINNKMRGCRGKVKTGIDCEKKLKLIQKIDYSKTGTRKFFPSLKKMMKIVSSLPTHPPPPPPDHLPQIKTT